MKSTDVLTNYGTSVFIGTNYDVDWTSKTANYTIITVTLNSPGSHM